MANNIYLPPTQIIPNTLTISAITRSYPMIVTVEEVNLYMPRQSLHFTIPNSYGMVQLDQMTGTIIQIIGLDFYMDINSTQFDSFVIPVSGSEAPATVSPAGSNNLQFNNDTNYVPFQALNNIGN